ncbi:FAD dependent oxidoreductase [Pleomassaria siparia CBS 279.74]|uniref:FAD dependent oxidoreductase n=1 Tax=Pleomassaria siparia CBS 279.74 TaxID=1314801 RepID=A0A6G1KFF9_9PLEO|nr:FAD dependent oxidoreductase [Pleomassaria siparia CBS 279.74]
MATTSPQPKNIVIVGGGIIGSTTAYFLSHDGNFDREKDSITLLEASEIAGGASGKAGGLLALWAYPKCIVPLSYGLHKELADKHNGSERWGYRALHCGQIEATGQPKANSNPAKSLNSVSLQKRSAKATALLRAANVPRDLDWITPESITAYESMGDPQTTAQVHPYQFTTSMAALSEEKGVKIVYGMATKIKQEAGAVTGVSFKPKDSSEEQELQADTVIITAGPWTRSIWPSAPIEALRAHSVVITPSRPVSAYALFTAIDVPKGSKRRETVTPEIYARPNNSIYACGEGDTLVPLPSTTVDVKVDLARCQDIVDQVGSISEELRDGEVTARQACYLPNVAGRGGGPLVGETGVKGLLMGAGHTCWGIQNAPATGKLLSEMVWDGRAVSADIRSLDPRNFM